MNFDREWLLNNRLIHSVDGDWNENYQVDGVSECTWLIAAKLKTLESLPTSRLETTKSTCS